MRISRILILSLTAFLLSMGCSNNDDNLQESESLSKRASDSKGSVINQTYPQAQAEVLEAFGGIAESIRSGAGQGYYSVFMDQLISFHAYGDKFTEFNEGKLFDSAGNEHNERQLFGEDLKEDGVIQFAAIEGTLKVAVYYGNVANVTFISDFILDHKEYGEITVNNLITLLFVKTNGEWKIAHEQHTPAALDNTIIAEESGSDFKSSRSKSSAINQTYSRAQNEVLETFGAIGESIRLGAGRGYNGEYMDQLISFHAYGDKFTEFNEGQIFDSAGNEHNERQLFGEDLKEDGVIPVSYTHLTLPTTLCMCRSRWSPYH